MKKLKLVEFKETKDQYEVIQDENTELKNPVTRAWEKSVVYREFKKYDKNLNKYILVPEDSRKTYVRVESDFLEKFIPVMPKTCIFFYGMSGTFKATIMKKFLEDKDPSYIPMWSMIKPWKNLESGILKDRLTSNDLNFAALHLSYLSTFNSGEFLERNLLVERGVTDMAFYFNKNNSFYHKLEERDIKELVEEESRICNNKRIDKFLLVQEDKEFIKKVVLKEPSRREQFPTVEDYLAEQEDYINFTKKYNLIEEDKIIYIESAKDYLEKLGIEYRKEEEL